MKIYKTEEFVNEKLDIKPITKTRLKDLQVNALPTWNDTKVNQEAKKWAE